jgi:hypothetical protein
MKPVAYMTKSGILFKNAPDAPLELTPLYEMPKPLSEEEINKIYLEHNNKKWDWQIDFARAIQERHGIK